MNEPWNACGHNEPDLEVLSETALAMAQATIQRAVDESEISRAELARKMDRPRSYVTRIMSGSHNLTVKTMARSLAACGYEIDFGLVPVRWNWTIDDNQVVECDNTNTVPSLEGTLVRASAARA